MSTMSSNSVQGERKNKEMKYESKQSQKKDEAVENNGIIPLDIIRHASGGNSGLSNSRGSNPFEPRLELSDHTPSDRKHHIPDLASLDAPEKKLTLYALRLAIIEKTACGLGQLAFVWATVVLLGGFASALRPKDFWFVTAILVVEGARLFSRSHELEWQHQSTRSVPAATTRRRIRSHLSIPRRFVRAAMRPLSVIARPSRRLAYSMQQLDGLAALTEPKRTWLPANVPILPYSGWVFVSKNISRLLYWLQIVAAAACVALSLMRLGQQDYGGGQTNEKSALSVFYGLALAEALMFLLEKG